MSEKSYKNWYAKSDKAILKQLGAFVKQQRLEQNRKQEELATAAGISRSTLSLLERGEGVTLLTFIQVLRVLDQLHHFETFRKEEQVSPLELAKQDQQKRERARTKGGSEKKESDW